MTVRLRQRTLDLLVVIALVFVACAATVLLPLNFLVSTLLFFGLPSAYLIAKKPAILGKAVISALVFGVIWGFSFDFVAELNKAWDWTPQTGAAIPHDLFGVVSADVMIWFFLWVFLAIAFYEYFIDGVHRKLSKRALPIALAGAALGTVIVVTFAVAPSLLQIPYAYLVLGLFTLTAYAYIIRKDPRLLLKSLRVVPFFAFLYLACELSSLYKGLWAFPGQYIGTITLLQISFPLEEFFFWILASSAVAVAYYEYAIDDEK